MIEKTFKEIKSNLDKVSNNQVFQKLTGKLERFSILQLSTVSASMAYYMTMAIFPFIILLVSVLVNLSQKIELPVSVLQESSTLIPPPVLEVLKPIFKEISEKFHFSTISVGALSILWASTRGWDTFIHTMDKIYKQESRNFLLKKLWGFLFVFSLILSIILLLLSVSFGNVILAKLYEWGAIPFFYHQIINLGRILLPILFIILLLSFLYHLMSRRQSKFRYAFRAAILPTVLWIAVFFGFSWYVDNFTKFSLIYGSLMGIIILSFWLYLMMQSILLGAFLHSEILVKKEKENS